MFSFYILETDFAFTNIPEASFHSDYITIVKTWKYWKIEDKLSAVQAEKNQEAAKINTKNNNQPEHKKEIQYAHEQQYQKHPT